MTYYTVYKSRWQGPALSLALQNLGDPLTFSVSYHIKSIFIRWVSTITYLPLHSLGLERHIFEWGRWYRKDKALPSIFSMIHEPHSPHLSLAPRRQDGGTGGRFRSVRRRKSGEVPGGWEKRSLESRPHLLKTPTKVLCMVSSLLIPAPLVENSGQGMLDCKVYNSPAAPSPPRGSQVRANFYLKSGSGPARQRPTFQGLGRSGWFRRRLARGAHARRPSLLGQVLRRPDPPGGDWVGSPVGDLDSCSICPAFGSGPGPGTRAATCCLLLDGEELRSIGRWWSIGRPCGSGCSRNPTEIFNPEVPGTFVSATTQVFYILSSRLFPFSVEGAPVSVGC